MITEKKIQKVAETMTPEAAAEFLDHGEFYIYRGSRRGHAGRRGKGDLRRRIWPMTGQTRAMIGGCATR